MHKFLIALMATVAVPATAMAQDSGRDDRGPRMSRSYNSDNNGAVRREAIEPTPVAMPEPPRTRAADGNRGGWNRGDGGARRGDGNRGDGNRGDRGQWRGGQADRPAAPPVVQAQPAQPRGDWNRPDRPRRDGGFAGAIGLTPDRDRARDGRRDNDRRDWNGRNDDRRDWNGRDGRRDDRRDWNGRDGRRDWNGRDNRNGWNDGNRWSNDRRAGTWDRGWRNDRRYNWQGYRASNRNAYRLPRYYAPYGWNYGYRRFSIGATLFAGLFAQDYWIADPWDYRLPPVQWPYQWVRYYNDALLVDTRSGYVVDSIQDIFWY